MKIRKVRNRLVLIIALGVFALGCELIVDFDRTKIPAEGTEAGTTDSSVDASIDTSQPDTSTAETGADASDSGDASADAADGD